MVTGHLEEGDGVLEGEALHGLLPRCQVVAGNRSGVTPGPECMAGELPGVDGTGGAQAFERPQGPLVEPRPCAGRKGLVDRIPHKGVGEAGNRGARRDQSRPFGFIQAGRDAVRHGGDCVDREGIPHHRGRLQDAAAPRGQLRHATHEEGAEGDGQPRPLGS